MKINYNPKIQFYGIHIRQGGEEYVHNEGGENAVESLHMAKEKFKGSRWNLIVDKGGYTLESPDKKAYKGPFSVKRLFKSGGARKDTTKLVIRMDKANRMKFPVFIPTKANLDKWYKLIKSTNGLEKMLHIMSVLEIPFR